MKLSPTSPLRERRIADVNRAYAAYLDAGMPLVDYPGETIQCRNELDRTNWLGLKDICEEAIAAALGDEPIPEPGIRCTSNNFIRPTFSATLELMRLIRGYALAAQANWWRLKDLCRTARTAADLEAIDLSEGWP